MLVVGDIIIDSYIKGDTERISPEAPVPVVLQTSIYHTLGGAANVAQNIASLGGSVALLGIVGRDEEADVARKLAHTTKITPYLIEDSTRPTTVKLRITSRRSQLLRIDKEMTHCIAGDVEKKLIQTILEIPKPDLVVLSDYVKGCVTKNVVATLARRVGKKNIIADIKPANAHLCRNLLAITPNTKEAHEIMATLHHKLIHNPEHIAKTISDQLNTSLVLTRGEHGMTIYDRKKKRICHVPSRAVTIHDVTGAGDTVIAAMALMLAAGADLYTAANFANHAAGFVVSKEGTATVTIKERSEIVRNYEANY